jgi:hypothetical protein
MKIIAGDIKMRCKKPYQKKESPYTEKGKPFVKKESPYKELVICYSLLQENGNYLLQENKYKILL